MSGTLIEISQGLASPYRAARPLPNRKEMEAFFRDLLAGDEEFTVPCRGTLLPSDKLPDSSGARPAGAIELPRFLHSPREILAALANGRTVHSRAGSFRFDPDRQALIFHPVEGDPLTVNLPDA